MDHREDQPGCSLGLKIQKKEVLWRFQREVMSSCASSRPVRGSRVASGREMKRETEGRAAGLQVGVGGTSLAMMAASTSDFWREVLKTPS